VRRGRGCQLGYPKGGSVGQFSTIPRRCDSVVGPTESARKRGLGRLVHRPSMTS